MNKIMGKPMQREVRRIPLGMKPGKRQLNDAELIVSLSHAAPENMRKRTREIVSFYVPQASRGKRLGTALMNFVCQEADANLITLLLTARPSEGDDAMMSEDKLIAWYEKFGFMKLQETPTGWLMARKVQRRAPQVLAVRDNVISLAVRKAIMDAQREGAANGSTQRH